MYFFLIFLLLPSTINAKERIRFTQEMTDREIRNFHPREVDPSMLPLDSVEQLHVTGTVEGVNIQNWLLEKARVKDSYSSVSFYALDGFVEHFSREEVENLHIILALRVSEPYAYDIREKSLPLL